MPKERPLPRAAQRRAVLESSKVAPDGRGFVEMIVADEDGRDVDVVAPLAGFYGDGNGAGFCRSRSSTTATQSRATKPRGANSARSASSTRATCSATFTRASGYTQR